MGLPCFQLSPLLELICTISGEEAIWPDGWMGWFDAPMHGCYHQIAGWSSLVARWAHNPKVGGSNPPPATKTFRLSPRSAGKCEIPPLCGYGNPKTHAG